MHSVVKHVTLHNTVPVIFINGQKVGGYDELMMAYQKGKLDAMLGASGASPANIHRQNYSMGP